MKVAIIGAGVSGIVSLKSCLEEDLDAVCYEQSYSIGGGWAQDEDNQSRSMYDSLITNTSKEIMAYSDYPMPANWPTFPTPSMVFEYLTSYCAHFNLMDRILLKHEVVDIAQAEDHDVTGKWMLTIKHKKKTSVHVYDAVMICSGLNGSPNIPDIPNMDKFKGHITHSQHYKNHTSYSKKQSILVYGNCSSGLDIACDLCDRKPTAAVRLLSRGLRWLTEGIETAAVSQYGESAELDEAMGALSAHTTVLDQAVQQTSNNSCPVSAHGCYSNWLSSGDLIPLCFVQGKDNQEPVYLSARSPVLVLERNYGSPGDFKASWFVYDIVTYLPWLVNKILKFLTRPAFRKKYSRYNMPVPDLSKLPTLQLGLAVNDQIFHRLDKQQIKPVPSISEFTKHGAKLTNGEELKLDAVIMATGYKIKLPFINKNLLDPDDWQLYKQVWPVSLTKNSLAVIGHIRSTGPIPPLCELQARWAVQVFKGSVKLPSNEIMKMRTKPIDPEANLIKQLIIPYVTYSRELAAEVGCSPSIYDVLVQPIRWIGLYFGPPLPFIHRLVGPGKWPKAWNTIQTAKSRIRPSQAELAKQVADSANRLKNLQLAGLVGMAVVIYVIYLGRLLYATYELFWASWDLICATFGLFSGLLALVRNWLFQPRR